MGWNDFWLGDPRRANPFRVRVPSWFSTLRSPLSLPLTKTNHQYFWPYTYWFAFILSSREMQTPIRRNRVKAANCHPMIYPIPRQIPGVTTTTRRASPTITRVLGTVSFIIKCGNISNNIFKMTSDSKLVFGNGHLLEPDGQHHRIRLKCDQRRLQCGI